MSILTFLKKSYVQIASKLDMSVPNVWRVRYIVSDDLGEMVDELLVVSYNPIVAKGVAQLWIKENLGDVCVQVNVNSSECLKLHELFNSSFSSEKIIFSAETDISEVCQLAKSIIIE